jgi:hypothetical protein
MAPRSKSPLRAAAAQDSAYQQFRRACYNAKPSEWPELRNFAGAERVNTSSLDWDRNDEQPDPLD